MAGSGTFSLAGAAAVQVYDLHTHAYIGNSAAASAAAGDHAIVDAGGTVQVSASDNTNDFLLAGSLGIGGGAGGVGGSVSILVINKDTKAYIGDYASVDGRGNTGVGALVSDGTIATTREDILHTKRRLNEIYVKHTGQPYERVEKTLDRDHFMTAEEAKACGIVDRVYEKREPAEGSST